ncbi:MAG TPA: YkgJ family cysteine cluster protein [Longimicrobium sp.]|nr:YkgJ family cysteine cluster protein [Longimicrobium sp.]
MADPAENGADPLHRLERQVERGSLFVHTAVSRNADQVHEVESFVYGLIDVLVQKGVVTQDELLQAAGGVRRQMEEAGQTVGPGLALRVDGPEGAPEPPFVPVNCAERLHVCKAACCSLNFALSAEEVEGGRVKWDLGAPYYIRQESSGCCTHLTPDRRGCSVYADRPGVCRRYSCAHDERIWKDFDGMVLNDEWIATHLGENRLRLASARMLPVFPAPRLPHPLGEGLPIPRPGPQPAVS